MCADDTCSDLIILVFATTTKKNTKRTVLSFIANPADVQSTVHHTIILHSTQPHSHFTNRNNMHVINI